MNRFITLVALAILPGPLRASELEVVAEFGERQPIGMAVSAKPNRVFVSFPHREPFVNALVEIVNGKEVAFPNAAWNAYQPEDWAHHFFNVQDLYADDRHNLWVLDPHGHPKLVRIDLEKNAVADVYTFDGLPKESALNDMVVDHTHGLAYLSDPGLAAIVVLDLKTRAHRVVLRNDPATLAEPGFKLRIEDKDVEDANGRPFVSNVNGIALTHDDQWFYFRAINQPFLYRIDTRHLADASLTDKELSAKVEKVAETGVCHGMVAGHDGKIYLTDSAHKEIRYVSPEGVGETLVRDERLIWPDSTGIGSDGYLYLTCSQINRGAGFNGGKARYEFPFRAYKVKLP